MRLGETTTREAPTSVDATPPTSLALNAARRLILKLWREYSRKPHPTPAAEMGSFFRWLESEHPDVLQFPFTGSKGELIRRWLKHDGKVRASLVRAGSLPGH